MSWCLTSSSFWFFWPRSLTFCTLCSLIHAMGKPKSAKPSKHLKMSQKKEILQLLEQKVETSCFFLLNSRCRIGCNESGRYLIVDPRKSDKALPIGFSSPRCIEHLPYSVLRTASVLVISNKTDILRYPNRMFESRSNVVADLRFILFNYFAIFRFRCWAEFA